MTRTTRAKSVYYLGVAAGSAAGFSANALHPGLWCLGFIPLSAGLIWAAYDLVEVDDGKPPSVPQ